jgi:hypothetical protein
VTCGEALEFAAQIVLQSDLDQVERAARRINQEVQIAAHAHREGRHRIVGAQYANLAQRTARSL